MTPTRSWLPGRYIFKETKSSHPSSLNQAQNNCNDCNYQQNVDQIAQTKAAESDKAK